MPLAQAMKESDVSLPPVEPIAARRIQIANAQGEIPPALKMLFSLGPGKSRMFPAPQGKGFIVVKVTKITPANALAQPQHMQSELQQGVSGEYAAQFLAGIRQDVRTKRNESAINALRTRLASGGG